MCILYYICTNAYHYEKQKCVICIHDLIRVCGIFIFNFITHNGMDLKTDIYDL
jgi:hypothetical protein